MDGEARDRRRDQARTRGALGRDVQVQGLRGQARLGFREVEGALEGGGLRRHAGRAAVCDGHDHRAADTGGEGAAGEGRLHRRHAGDGLADGGVAAHAQGAAGQGRLFLRCLRG